MFGDEPASGSSPSSREPGPQNASASNSDEGAFFDPMATNAYDFELSEPARRASSKRRTTPSKPPPQPETSKQAIVDLRNPEQPFSSTTARPSFSFPRVSGPPPLVQQKFERTPRSKMVVDVRNPSNVHAFEEPTMPPVGWFQQPLVWLVGGLFLVGVLFIALLFQDLKTPDSPAPVPPQPLEQPR